MRIGDVHNPSGRMYMNGSTTLFLISSTAGNPSLKVQFNAQGGRCKHYNDITKWGLGLWIVLDWIWGGR